MMSRAIYVLPFALVASLVACSGDGLEAVASDGDASADGAAAPATDLAGEANADPSAPAAPSGTPDTSGDPSTTPDPVDADGGSADAGAASDAALGDAARGDGGGREFGKPCTADAQCESRACFRGNGGGGGGGGGYCSIRCNQADAGATCPKPQTSGQCNTRGFCKRP